MSGLFDSLSVAARGLDAQRTGLDVAGQNLANLNTVGYTRRVLTLAEQTVGNVVQGGGGVEIVGINSARDPFIENRIRNESRTVQYDTAFQSGLAGVQAVIGTPGAALDSQLTGFFDAWATLAQDPTSGASRQQVVSQGQSLSSYFNDLSNQLAGTQTAADQGVRASVDTANNLISQVADLNRQVADAGGHDVEALIDRRTTLIGQLTDIVGGAAVPQTDGSMNVTAGNGRALIVGTAAYPLSVTSAPTTGLARVISNGTDITDEFSSGTIGGQLAVRDKAVPSYVQQLDQLAFDVSTHVNALHQAGFTAGGALGQTFFAPIAQVSGAAASIHVTTAVAADPSLVAASSTGTAGDNHTALAIAGLRDATIASSNAVTPAGAWAAFVYRVGSDNQLAQNSQANSQAVLTQLNTLRDSVSGVSVDEESAALMKYQMAYEAGARYFVTISQTLSAFMSVMQGA